jgi:hypothetical protein
MPDQGSYAYFIYGTGERRGQQAKHQEATGIALALLFAVGSESQQPQILEKLRTTPYGVPLVDPGFARYAPDHPGRHERMIWPMAQGYWGTVFAKAGAVRRFQQEAEHLVGLVEKSAWNFREIYHPATGRPDGGWQCGIQWASCSHQTWSATAWIRMIHYGLFGMQFEPQGIRFAPSLPASWGPVQLEGLHYRGMVLSIQLRGGGNRIASAMLDGAPLESPWLPAHLTGSHRLELELVE